MNKSKIVKYYIERCVDCPWCKKETKMDRDRIWTQYYCEKRIVNLGGGFSGPDPIFPLSLKEFPNICRLEDEAFDVDYLSNKLRK